MGVEHARMDNDTCPPNVGFSNDATNALHRGMSTLKMRVLARAGNRALRNAPDSAKQISTGAKYFEEAVRELFGTSPAAEILLEELEPLTVWENVKGMQRQ